MKKMILAMLILALFILPCAAAEGDYFYYDYSNEELNAALESEKKIQIFMDKRYLKEWYLPEGEEVDESKISHGTDTIYWEHNWTGAKVVEFLDAPDKLAFLQQMEVSKYWYPCYYDGVQIPYFESLDYLNGKYTEASSSNNMDYMLDKLDRMNLEKVIQRLEQDDLGAYKPLYSMILRGSWFVYVEKEGVNYLIYMPTEEDSGYWHNGGIEDNMDLLQKRVLTVEEAKQFMTKYQQAIDAMPESSGQSAGTTPDNTIDSGTPSAGLLWYLLGGIAVLIGVVVLLILLRRKKITK